MKNYTIIIILFMLVSCESGRKTYWCGDHPCINKKEKESYFKKTGIVEIKNLKKIKDNNNSQIEKITKQADKNEKKIIKEEKELTKQLRLEEKMRIKEEKELAKQVRLEEKMRIKEEKELAKQVRLEEKMRIKQEKELARQSLIDKKDITIKKKKINKNNDGNLNKEILIEADIVKIDIDNNAFKNLVGNIKKRNMSKPYPNINSIPN